MEEMATQSTSPSKPGLGLGLTKGDMVSRLSLRSHAFCAPTIRPRVTGPLDKACRLWPGETPFLQKTWSVTGAATTAGCWTVTTQTKRK